MVNERKIEQVAKKMWETKKNDSLILNAGENIGWSDIWENVDEDIKNSYYKDAEFILLQTSNFIDSPSEPVFTADQVSAAVAHVLNERTSEFDKINGIVREIITRLTTPPVEDRVKFKYDSSTGYSVVVDDKKVGSFTEESDAETFRTVKIALLKK